MTDLEVRGFLTTGCAECMLAETSTGGYDNSEIKGYFCKINQREIGTRHKLPDGFPDHCRLKLMINVAAKEHQKYKRVVDLLKTATSVIEER